MGFWNVVFAVLLGNFITLLLMEIWMCTQWTKQFHHKGYWGWLNVLLSGYFCQLKLQSISEQLRNKKEQ